MAGGGGAGGGGAGVRVGAPPITSFRFRLANRPGVLASGPVGSYFGPVWKLVVDFECEVAAGSEEEEGVIRNCERSVAGEMRFPLADGSLG